MSEVWGYVYLLQYGSWHIYLHVSILHSILIPWTSYVLYIHYEFEFEVSRSVRWNKGAALRYDYHFPIISAVSTDGL